MMPLPDGSHPNPIDPLRPEAQAALGWPKPGHPLPCRHATGPKTQAGKARSRANAVKHGLRCEVVEPTDQAPRIAERIREWTDALQPTDTVQRWLVARAATASVRLDRCTERETLALEENTAQAERDFFRRRRAWARRTGARLPKDPKKAFAQLNGSAFGCDWQIARWEELVADLEIPGGYWSRAEFLHALLLLGFDYDRIPPGQPMVAGLYRASLAADRAPDPEEVDAFLKLDTKALDPEARAAAQRKALGEREAGRLVLRNFVRAEQERLRQLRKELWEAIDAPALEAACARARTFDACPDAALARRYEASQALELHRNLNGFYRAHREAETRQGNTPAPNERQDGQGGDATPVTEIAFANASIASPASPDRSPRVTEASPGPRKNVASRDQRAARKAARIARKRSRRKGQ